VQTHRRHGNHEARLARHHIQLLVGLDDPLDSGDGKDGGPCLLFGERLSLLDYPFLLLLACWLRLVLGLQCTAAADDS
jgi:hypothetical protein